MSTLSVASVTALDSNTNLSLTTANGSLVIANTGNITTSSDLTVGNSSQYTILSVKTSEGGDIYGYANNGNDIVMEHNWGNNYLVSYCTRGNYFIGTKSVNGGDIVFQTVSDERMRIAANGNIGIGTSTPFDAVSVERNTNTSFFYSIKNLSPGNTSSGQVAFNAENSNGDYIGIGIRPKNWDDGFGYIYSVSKLLFITCDAGKGSFSGNTTDSSVGSIVFATSSNNSNYTEPMRIVANGNIGIGTFPGSTRLAVFTDRADLTFDAWGSSTATTSRVYNTNNSFIGACQDLVSFRTGSTDYAFSACYSSNFGDLEFYFRGDGNAFADGAFTGGGADYAEYFEWSDGNPDDEDRRGYSVVLDGSEQIRPATANDAPSAIIGVISAMPVVVGDAAWNKWNQKYLHDDFGSYIMEDYEVWEWEEEVLKEQSVSRPSNTEPQYETKTIQYVSDEIPETVYVPDTKRVIVQQRRKLNPEYNPELDYVPREQRPEWDAVGLMGKLRLRKGQPVGDRWIKMRDVSDNVEEWLVR